MEVDVVEGKTEDGSAEIKLGFDQSSCLLCATEILVLISAQVVYRT
jgi:hypothetical protein